MPLPPNPLLRRDSQIALLGDTQRFECQVVGFPAPIVRWFKDNLDITENPRYGISYDPTRGIIMLSLKDVTHDDEGCYQCRAENSEGYATTTAYLVVRVSHRHEFTRDYQSMIVEKVSEEETTQVQLSKSDRHTIIEEVITRIEETEQEIFEEKVIPPRITYDAVLSDPIALRAGATIYIEVDIHGQPFPSVAWFHGPRRLNDDARCTIETMDGFSVLRIKSVEETEAGEYKVTAENKAGKDEATFEVLVKTKPSPPRNVRIKEVYKDYITIEWDAPEKEGGEKITGYEIEKSLAGGMFVSAGYCNITDPREFKITKLYEGNEYLFQVIAINKIGNSKPACTEKPCKAKLPFDPPGQPNNFCVQEVHKDYIVVSWEPPASDGGSKIMQYIVEKRDATRAAGMFIIVGTADANDRSFKVTRLFQGNAYQFRLAAENRVGPGPFAEILEPVVAKLPFDKPGAPRFVKALETSVDYIVVGWEAPEQDGGSPITAYIVEKRDAKRSDYIFISELAPDCFQYKAGRLFAGNGYYFRVIAENIIGPGEPGCMDVPAIAKLPFDEPGSPRNLRVTDYWTDHISLAWDAPEADGGSEITGYIIEKRDALRTTWVKAGATDANTHEFKCTSLFEGGDYLFRVFAENKIGPSLKACELDRPVRAKMPFDPPFSPCNLRVTAYDVDYISLAWDKPGNDGGSPILRYMVERRDAQRQSWLACGSVEPDVSTFKCGDLIEGEAYFFRIAAENQVGRGDYAETIDTQKAKLPFDPPSTPRDLRATDIWRDYIQLIWSAPDTDGGSPLTGYTLEQRDALEPGFKFLASLDANTTAFQATNLKEGHEYYYRVFSQNKSGNCEKPAQMHEPIKAKLPFDKPSSPRNLSCTGVADGSISISWEHSSNDGGSPLTGYVIEFCLSMDKDYTAAASKANPSATSFDINGLRIGGDYFVRVKAENMAGVSKATEIMEIIRAKAAVFRPPPPSHLGITAVKARSVSMIWEPPTSDGGSPINSYVIQCKKSDAGDYDDIGMVDSSTFTYTALGLKEGQAYIFGVRSENMAGLSESACLLKDPVTPKGNVEPPGGPCSVRSRDIESGSLTLEWERPMITGGSPITGYIIEISTNGSDFSMYKHTDGDCNSLKVGDLKDDTMYYLRVIAENAAGRSSPVGLGLGSDGVRTKKKKPEKPSSPRNLTATRVTTDSVTLSWEAPEFSGNTEIIAYTVETKEGDGAYRLTKTVDGGVTTAQLLTLKAGTKYSVQVYAENFVGRCDKAAELSQAFQTPAEDTPQAPVEEKVKEEPIHEVKEVPVEETVQEEPISEVKEAPVQEKVPETPAPVEEVVKPVETPKVEEAPPAPVEEKVEEEPVQEVREVPVQEKAPETPAPVEEVVQPVEVPKVEEAPPAPVVEQVKEEPKPSAPSTPDNLRVLEATESSVTITWEKPTSDGGAPVTHYIVSMRSQDKNKFKEFAQVEASCTQYSITDMKKKKEYYVQLEAVNEAGASEPAAEIKEPLMLKKKEEPVKEKTPEPAKEEVKEPVEEKVEEAPVEQVKEEPKLSAPSTPGNLCVLEATESSVTITWEKPTSDGGAPITNYVVSMRSQDKNKFKEVAQVEASCTQYIITDMKKKKEYYVKLEAVNEAGASEPAAEIKEPIMLKQKEEVVEEAPKATAPTSAPESLVVLESTEEYVTIQWESPKEDGGSPITHYTVSIKDVEKKKFKQIGEVDVSTTNFKISEMKPDKSYEVQVQAKNEVGVGEKAAVLKEPIKLKIKEVIEETTIEETKQVEVEAAPVEETIEETKEVEVKEAPKPTAPAAPSNLVVKEATESSLTVAWELPSEDGGSPLKHFTVSVQEQGKSYQQVAIVESSVTMHTITELKADTEYQVKVEAVNEVGSSAVELDKPAKVPKKEEPVVAPEITEKPEPVSLKAGETLKLTCKITAQPEPDVNWYKNEKKLKAKKGKDLKMDKDGDLYFLEITTTTVEDAGKYTIKATNDGGSVSHDVTVTIEETIVKTAPQFTDMPKEVTILESETLTITVTIKSEPISEVSWFKDGKPLKPADDSRMSITNDKDKFTLTIKDSKSSDAGEYTATAVNSEGTVFHAIPVKIEPKPVAVEEEVMEEKAPEVESAPTVAPEFVKKPKSKVSVSEFEELSISATIKGSPEPDVKWFKEGKPLKEGDNLKISNKSDKYKLVIKKSSLLDAGEYTITADNSAGGSFAAFNVSVTAAEKDEEEAKEIEVLEKLADKIAEEKEKLKDAEEEPLFKEYPMLGDHHDATRGVQLQKDDIVQVMDTAKDDEWLCRKKSEPEKVCYVPVELLLGPKEKPKEEEPKKEKKKKKEKKEEVVEEVVEPVSEAPVESAPEKEDSDEEVKEEKLEKVKKYKVKEAVMDYEPTDDEKNALPLTEGTKVEVLDDSNPERWLCRRLDDHSKQGYVPPLYLTGKKDDKKSDGQKAFREDVMKLSDKKQEANMKRRYTLNDLWESEKDYISDMKFTLDNYYKNFNGDMPEELVGKKDYIFCTMPDILKFHDERFLPELMESSNNAASVGQAFLKHRDSFHQYVQYYVDRVGVDYLLGLDGPQKYLTDFDSKVGSVGANKKNLSDYLMRPLDRIDEYISLLQDVMKYSAQAKEDTTHSRDAIEMLMDLRKKAELQMTLKNIVGYKGDLEALGPLLRHEDFIVWEGEPTGNGHDRHLFLFNDRLLITRKKKAAAGKYPIYEFKSEIKIMETQLNEHLPNNRRFELWFPDIKRDKYVFQAESAPIKQAWCDELRRLLLQHGIEEESAAEFRHKLQDVAVKEQQEVTFSCTCNGYPRPTATWYKDKKELMESDGYTIRAEGDRFFLTITSCTLEHAGKYRVKIENRGGSAESKAKLDVEMLGVKPSFASNMEDINVVENNDVRFECKLSGKPSPDVKWFFKDKELSSGSRYKILVEEDTYILIISGVQMSDDGVYKCKASNKIGEASNKAKLIVAEDKKLPTFDTKFTDLEVARKDMAEFVAKISGKPEPKISWWCNKKELIENERISFVRRGDEYHLRISSIKESDEGMYTCKAKNEHGDSSCMANLYISKVIEEEELTLAYAPSFTKRLQDEDVLPGCDVRFECKCIGEPKPTAKWLLDDKLIEETDDRFLIKRDGNLFTLVLNNALDEDAGVYTCEVTNKAGSTSSSGELIIQRPIQRRRSSSMARDAQLEEAPVMPMTQPTVSDLTEDTFVLNWASAIYPPYAKELPIRYVIERKDLPSQDWRRVHADIKLTRFEIIGYDVQRDYMYRVLAENDVGISEPTSALSMYARTMKRRRRSFSVDKFVDRPKDKIAPRAPREKPNVYEVTAESVCLSWQPADVPPYAEQTEITYILERRCPPRKDWIDVSTDIKGVNHRMTGYKSQKDYMFRVRAVNKYGISDPSPTATLFAAPLDAKPVVVKKKESEEDLKPKVKPRTIWDKPDLQDIKDTSVTLRWQPSSCPSYAQQLKIWYIVEQRMPPNANWTKVATDVESSEYTVTSVNRKKDYYWRIRAVNEVGPSEPSMPAMLRRKEDWEDPDAEKRKKRSSSMDDGSRNRHIPVHLRIVPEFLGKLDDTQYGVEGLTSKVVTRLRSYPEPKITWFFGENKLDLGSKFNVVLTTVGELTLEIQDFGWTNCGDYRVNIENQFGSANLCYKMDMADPPTFLEPMKDQVFHLRKDGKLECRVHGVPYPTVQFKHDWRVIADSHRIKVAREDYDHWTLTFRNSIFMDEGMYECTAENIAGKVYCKCNVKITEKAGIPRDTSFKQVPLEDYFHVIEELGRGSSGVVRRVIDKNTGNQYACKFLRFADFASKEELSQELEVMADLYHPNLIGLIDGYEDKKRLAIVLEIVQGGPLLNRLVKEDSLTESEIAFYMRQLLLAVEHMHGKNILHMDIKPENLYMTEKDSDEIRLIDFGFARKYNSVRPFRAKYATPEFCAPEVAAEDTVTPAADLWSVGVVTYIILSGLSPFAEASHRETLIKVKTGSFEFDKEAFSNVSDDAKDFIRKLLTKDHKKRMTASAALDHPFIQLAFHRGLGDRIPLDRIKTYMQRRRWQRGMTTVKTFASPKSISAYAQEVPDLCMDLEVGISIDMENGEAERVNGDRRSMSIGSTAGSRAGSSERGSLLEVGAAGMLKVMGPLSDCGSVYGGSYASSEWGKEYEDEDTWYEWSSAYQSGPDTQLMPTKDTALSLRMQKYRRSTSVGPGAGRSSSRASSVGASSRMRSSGMRERRDLRDVDVEEDIFNAPTKSDSKSKRSVWQLRNMAESGTDEGFPPVFKEKIHDKAYNVGDSCTLRVQVLANPNPSVSWYRNDELLTDGGRVRTFKGEEGRHNLTILSTKPHDFGVFKCVARNKYGKVTCRARMLLGDHPTRPGRPHVTKVADSEVYMIWDEPEADGNSYILAYRVDWHRHGDERWTVATYCIDECALVKGLKPDTTYRLRVCAINKFGISPYSWASVEVKTKQKNAPCLDIDSETKKILLRSRQATSRPSPDPSPSSSRRNSLDDLPDPSDLADRKEDYDFLDREVHLQEVDPKKYLQFSTDVWRGRFTLIRNVKPKEGTKVRRVAKVIPYSASTREDSLREFEMLKSLRQEHIVRMYEGYLHNGFCVLVLEKLYGENVARSLSLKNKYNEYQVTGIIKQVLDAMQFLHHRGIVHLNLQPDNVIMVSRRRFDVKLIDFGRARKVTSYDGDKVDRLGTAEFMAPEKVNRERVGVAADIWGVGVLAFILVSGISPFRGDNDDETYANITHVRYDAHQIYHNVTKHALKFLFKALKRSPVARLTTEEALDNRWLMLNVPIVKQQKAAIFSTDRLRLFEEDYIQRRMEGAAPSEELLKAYGATGTEGFSSDEEDLFGSNND